MLRLRILFLTIAFICAPLVVRAQDGKLGIAMPVTISFEGLTTNRGQIFIPTSSNRAASFRAVLYPKLKLGSHWYVSTAVQISREPYFYYYSYYPTRETETEVLLGFVGYAWSGERKAASIKVGRLPSAFGSYPLRYDDASNSLIDSPLSYGYFVGLRPDQLPCGNKDLLKQLSYGWVNFSCGGSKDPFQYGMVPVTIYGIPAAEFDYSFHSLDTRFQITHSSPSNPQGLFSGSRSMQWTAGLGYTALPGLRIGASAFRGPFLNKSLSSLLPAGTSVRDFPATGVGFDVQWALGRLSATAEWHRIEYQYPGFQVPPAISTGYLELKANLTPRFYTAIRTAVLDYNHIEDSVSRSATSFQPNQKAYELAVGFHINHFQTAKLSYELTRTRGVTGNRENVLGLQVVTSINGLSKAFK